MNIDALSIDMIGLSVRSQNALHRAGVHTVVEMLEFDEDSLYKVRNLGKKSIDEILEKIKEYSKLKIEADKAALNPKQLIEPENFEEWIKEESGKSFVLEYLKDFKITELELLSAKAFNLLMLNGYNSLDQIAFLAEADLMQIPRMDTGSASEIMKFCDHYLREKSQQILETYRQTQLIAADNMQIAVSDFLNDEKYHDVILNYVKMNDKDIHQMNLPTRAVNCLVKQHLEKMSDIIFMNRQELLMIPSMGVGSAEAVMSAIDKYISDHEKRLIAICTGDMSSLLDDEAIRNLILNLYQDIGFDGLSFEDIVQQLQLSEFVSLERIKKNIGNLLAENELEYVDYRCYRVYEKFVDCFERCDVIGERSKDFIRKRLEGVTLEGIAKEYGLSRERVRQVVKGNVEKVENWHKSQTGKSWFDEDYFRYFYETYDFEKEDAVEWFGMSLMTCNYLDLMEMKRKRNDLQSALEDSKKLDTGLRLKVKNYLNRNKLFVDGSWVEKCRADLEEVVVRKFCKEDVSFDAFVHIYNEFLMQEEIPYDETIYYTPSVLRTRKNHLADAKYLLWKQNEQIRYYDIAGHDFTELLDILNLESYENIELSTLKFANEYPEILKKYDIRDQYELHNLLRKIIPEGSYHDFHCGRMPEIKFGTFDRNAAILDLIIDNAPISVNDLCNIIYDEYGYDPAVTQGTYLQPFTAYYHQGMYGIEQKVMNETRKGALMAELNDDFYYIDEIRTIYRKLFPDADIEEINPYNLKTMGFTVLSKYAVQHYPSLDAYFEAILTKEDIVDITPYRKRFVYVVTFSQKLMELKKSLQVIEFEPNQIINFRKLEKAGVTRELIQEFCNAVYNFLDDGMYFSVQSIKEDGFESELFDLGFSDWFYANLLISDNRFSFAMMYGNIIMYKGQENITIKSFEMNRIQERGSIDVYDLVSELTDRFGCKIYERFDVISKVQGTEIYYDKILDRLYANADVYYRELDEWDGI